MFMLEGKLCLIIWLFCVTLMNAENRQVINGDSAGITITVNESKILDFKCSASYNAEKNVKWYRQSGIDGNETEIYRNGILVTSDLGEEALAYSLNSTEFEVTMSIRRGLGQWIHGNKYRCEVIDSNNGNILFTGSQILLNVLYPPPTSDNPRCASTGYNQDYIGQTVFMSCYSLPGNPKVTLELWRNNIQFSSRETIFDHNTNRFMDVQLNHALHPLQAGDLEATFQCKIIWFQEVTTCIHQAFKPTSEPNASFATSSTDGMLKETDGMLYLIIGIVAVVSLIIGLIVIGICKRRQNGTRSYHEDPTTTEMNLPHLYVTRNNNGEYMNNYTAVFPNLQRNNHLDGQCTSKDNFIIEDIHSILVGENIEQGYENISENGGNRNTEGQVIARSEEYSELNLGYTALTARQGEQKRTVDDGHSEDDQRENYSSDRQYQKNETEVEINVPIRTENKKEGMGNYTKVIPKSLRNANIEKDKQAISTDKHAIEGNNIIDEKGNIGNGDMISESSINRNTGLRHDHAIVENEEYTSKEKPSEQERKVDKRCFQEKENENSSEVTDVQTTNRLSDSHEIEENILYSDY